MTNGEEPPERPATIGNVVVGKAKKVAGQVTGNDELEQEGDRQAEVAHEVREEFVEERDA